MQILKLLCTMSSRVDLVCDTYHHPSIKYAEHQRRGERDAEYVITGPDQKRPKEWHRALQSHIFKISLVRFLAREWQKAHICRIDAEPYHLPGI